MIAVAVPHGLALLDGEASRIVLLALRPALDDLRRLHVPPRPELESVIRVLERTAEVERPAVPADVAEVERTAEPDDRWMSTAEVAEMLQISTRQVSNVRGLVRRPAGRAVQYGVSSVLEELEFRRSTRSTDVDAPAPR